MTAPKYFSYSSLIILLIITCSACGPIEMIPFERSDDEQAADVVINSRLLSNFKRGFETIDNTQFVVITLEKTSPVDKEKSGLTLTYNRDLRKWQAVQSVYQYNGHGVGAQFPLRRYMQPSSSWLDLLNALADHNMLSLPGRSGQKSVAMVAEAPSFLLQLRIADRYKEIAMSDLENADFRGIVKVMEDAFVKSISQR